MEAYSDSSLSSTRTTPERIVVMVTSTFCCLFVCLYRKEGRGGHTEAEERRVGAVVKVVKGQAADNTTQARLDAGGGR